jgi:hypothetical protein
LYFSTKLETKSKAAYGQSIGTRCPALLTILSYKNPADFIEPTILSFIFHAVNKLFLKSSIF